MTSCFTLTHVCVKWLIEICKVLTSNNDTGVDVEDGGTYRAVDFVNAVKSVTLSQMEAALKALQHDLAKSSTGKACLGMFFFFLNIS